MNQEYYYPTPLLSSQDQPCINPENKNSGPAKPMAASSSLVTFLSPPISLPPKAPPSQDSQLKLLPSSFALLSLSSSAQSPTPRPTTSPHSHRFRGTVVPTTLKQSFRPSLPRDLLSVVCPSLASANVLFFSSGHHGKGREAIGADDDDEDGYKKIIYNVKLIPEEDEPEEQLVRRFRSMVVRAGIFQECKRRRFFETTQEKKKRKSREAARRYRIRRPPPREPPQDIFDKQGTSEKKGHDEEDEDDNWDVYDVEIPYS